MASVDIGLCNWQDTSANKTLVLGDLPTMGASDYIVKTGDFCQVGRYTYIATADVQRGGGSTVDIPIHRNLITDLATPIQCVIGQYGETISLGGGTYTGVTFPVILRQYPTYTLVPMTNDSFIAWSGEFVAFEDVL